MLNSTNLNHLQNHQLSNNSCNDSADWIALKNAGLTGVDSGLIGTKINFSDPHSTSTSTSSTLTSNQDPLLLTAACMQSPSNTQIFEDLLNMGGVDVNLPNRTGWTALMIAAFHGQTRIVSLLLAIPGIELNAANYFGYTALMIAIYKSRNRIVNLLIKAGASVNFRSGTSGMTSLMVAANGKDISSMHLLLSNGAELNTHNKLNGWTALMYLAGTSHISENFKNCVVLLMEKGADPFVRNNAGKNSIDIAKEIQNKAFLELLNVEPLGLSDSSFSSVHTASQTRDLHHPADSTLPKNPIFDAIFHKNRPLLLSLFTSDDISVSEPEPNTGFTPLIYAVIRGDNTAAKILLDCGCDINGRNPLNNWSALMYAVYYRHLHVVKTLLEKGADMSLCGDIFENSFSSSSKPSAMAVINCRDIALMNDDVTMLKILDMGSDISKQANSQVPRALLRPKKFLGKMIPSFIRPPARKMPDSWPAIGKMFNWLKRHGAELDDSSMCSSFSGKASPSVRRFFKTRKSINTKFEMKSAPDRFNTFSTPSFCDLIMTTNTMTTAQQMGDECSSSSRGTPKTAHSLSLSRDNRTKSITEYESALSGSLPSLYLHELAEGISMKDVSGLNDSHPRRSRPNSQNLSDIYSISDRQEINDYIDALCKLNLNSAGSSIQSNSLHTIKEHSDKSRDLKQPIDPVFFFKEKPEFY